jgi:hypothetical protein
MPSWATDPIYMTRRRPKSDHPRAFPSTTDSPICAMLRLPRYVRALDEDSEGLLGPLEACISMLED